VDGEIMIVAIEFWMKYLFCLSKRSSLIFFRKISFYPMPDATFLKISGAKLEVSTLPNSHFPSPFSIETSF